MPKRFLSYGLVLCTVFTLQSLFSDVCSAELFAANNLQKSVEQSKKQPVAKPSSALSPALSPTVIAAWKKAGARIGWVNPNNFSFSITQEANSLPAFWFHPWKGTDFSTLPAPQKPFALSVGQASSESIVIAGWQTTDASLKKMKLSSLKNLRSLDLDAAKITDAGLKTVAQLKNLQGLSLEWTAITNAGLKELTQLKQLQSLCISSSRVTSAGLQTVAKMKNLQSLIFNKGRELVSNRMTIANADLKALATLKNLHTLVLAETTTSDAGLKELWKLKKLRSLNLDLTMLGHRTRNGKITLRAYMTSKAIALLCQKIPLTTLSLRSCPYLSGTDVENIITKSRLESLDLKGCWFNMLTIAEMPHLKTLGLSYTRLMTDVEIINCPQLKTIDFQFCRGLESILLDGIPKIEKISFKCCTKFVDKQLTQLKRTAIQQLDLGYIKTTQKGAAALSELKSLQSLNLEYTQATDAQISKLVQLPNLQTLNITAAKITKAGIQQFTKMKNLHSLTLNLVKIKDAEMREIAKITTLRSLVLHYTEVTDFSLQELAKLKNLQALDVWMTPVTKAGIQKLKQALPKCKIREGTRKKNPGVRFFSAITNT